MPVPSDFVSTTFVDPEQLNSNKIWTRILQVLNTLFAWARTVPVPAYGVASGTTSAGGLATITHTLGAVPSRITVTGRTIHVYTIWDAFAATSTQFQISVNVMNTGVGLNAGAYKCDWVVWP